MKLIKDENREYWVNERGEFQGEYKAWHKNGQQHVHCFYDHGELHGEYKYWHDNGELWMHCFSNHGKLIRDFIKEPFTSDEERFEFALIHEGRWL